MTEDGGNNSLTFGLNVLDTTAAAYLTTQTQTANNGLIAATPAITRSNTATVWDQYGDTVAGNVVSFASSPAVTGGAICTDANPSVCTFPGPHGLKLGDQLTVVSAGAWEGVTTTQTDANSPLCVSVVSSTTEVNFKVAHGDDVVGTSCAGAVVAANGETASTAASPVTFTVAELASTDRTTGSTGQATYSWVDTSAASRNAAVVATGAGTTAATTSFYRTIAAATFAETDPDNDDAFDANDIMAGIESLNAASDYAIAKIRTFGADAAYYNDQYMKLAWDSGDQFAINATAVVAGVAGTPSTQAAFETDAAALGAWALGDLANWTIHANGISTDTNVFRTG